MSVNLVSKIRSLCIGCGGHGAACIFPHIINNPNHIFDIILLTCDDGGCTGRINQFFNHALNTIPSQFLGNLKPSKPSIALGDLKNNILAWVPLIFEKSLEEKGFNKSQSESITSDFKKYFECRSDNFYMHNQCFLGLCKYFPKLVRFQDEFLKVSHSYLKTVEKLNAKTSFGNLLLQVIYVNLPFPTTINSLLV